MDEVAAFNQARWRALAEADALYTRPALNLDVASARARVDPDVRVHVGEEHRLQVRRGGYRRERVQRLAGIPQQPLERTVQADSGGGGGRQRGTGRYPAHR